MERKHHNAWGIFYCAMLFTFLVSAAGSPQKAIMSDDLLDRLNELEKIYIECLKAGMQPEIAQHIAVKWQDERYAVRLPTIPEGKEPEKKSPKSKIKKSDPLKKKADTTGP